MALRRKQRAQKVSVVAPVNSSASVAVERARRELENSALATAFRGPTFTISELQRVHETVWGIPP